MTIAFQCTNCARRLRAGDEAAGKRVKCPGCATVVTVTGALTAMPPKQSGAVPKGKASRNASVTAKKRRQPVPDDDEEERGPPWLLIAGGSAAVLLLTAAVLFFVMGGFGGGQPIASAPPPNVPEPKASLPGAPEEVKQPDPKQVELVPAANNAGKVEPKPPVEKAAKPGPEKPPVAKVEAPPVEAKPRPDPVRYLPDETKWFATINVRQLAKAALMRQPLVQIREEMRNQPMLFELFGFDPFADLTRVNVAGTSPIGESLFVVARGRFDLDKVHGGAKAMFQAVKGLAAGGGVHEFYEFPAEAKSNWRFAIVDATTLLASNHKDWLLAALDEHAGRRAGTMQHAGMRDLL
jgi:hypothetical protein